MPPPASLSWRTADAGSKHNASTCQSVLADSGHIKKKLLIRVYGTPIGVAFCQSSFTDLDFADDVSLLAELLELLVPTLETMASEAASLGLEVNWQKTKVQALDCKEDMPLIITVQG